MNEQPGVGSIALFLFGGKALIVGAIGIVVGVCALLAAGLFLTLSATISTTQAGGQNNRQATAVVNVPAEYVTDVERAGTVCPEVSAPLIAAQIEAESGWNPQAVSPVGAQGISQFMPGTWQAVGKDGDNDGVADPFNPHDAIWSQAHYMCGQVEQVTALRENGRISGDIIDLALAAYNAGLGNVRLLGGIPPFAETQNYIARIKKRIPHFTGEVNGGLDLIQATGQVKDALAWAKSVADNPRSYYILGGEGPLGYDCSGLTQEFMERLGVSIPHFADTQARLGQQISEAEAKPGDLIFWSHNGGAVYYHTAIYAGNGMMISADNPAEGINYSPIWGREQHIIFKRFVK